MALLKDSTTRENLMKAYAGECQAWRRYEIAAELAKTQKLQVLYWLFNYTGGQEKAHAEVFYNHLKEFTGQEISITADYPVENSNNLLELLQAAVQHETAEHDTIYKTFAETAQEEGFPQIANSFNMVAQIEQEHSQRFACYAQLMQNNQLFKCETATEYLCLHCGHIHRGTDAPQTCPVCSHDQGFFIRHNDSPFGK